jgi:hypothetical protein
MMLIAFVLHHLQVLEYFKFWTQSRVCILLHITLILFRLFYVFSTIFSVLGGKKQTFYIEMYCIVHYSGCTSPFHRSQLTVNIAHSYAVTANGSSHVQTRCAKQQTKMFPVCLPSGAAQYDHIRAPARQGTSLTTSHNSIAIKWRM